MLGPEASRRARGLATWATLRAYGRAGYRAMIERHLDLAQHLAARIRARDDMEVVADVPLNIVPFRYRPRGVAPDALDDLNARIGRAVLTDGRVYMGTTRYRGMTVFRPAIVNWRTTEKDVELIVDVVRELGTRERSAVPAR
jgi:glutamate/tyrosine decarboxylase-like PLP-dependent enzyme